MSVEREKAVVRLLEEILAELKEANEYNRLYMEKEYREKETPLDVLKRHEKEVRRRDVRGEDGL